MSIGFDQLGWLKIVDKNSHIFVVINLDGYVPGSSARNPRRVALSDSDNRRAAIFPQRNGEISIGNVTYYRSIL